MKIKDERLEVKGKTNMNPSAKNKIWRYREYDGKPFSFHGMTLPPLLAGLLAQRRLHEDNLDEFFNPQLSRLPPPFEMKGVEQGCELVERALLQKQPVIIYGDYDVDGVTSTSLLYLFLKELGAQVSYFVPDRFKEGYGLDINALQGMAEKNRQQYGQTGLLISVDCGISAVEEVRKAKQNDFTVIITDHHQPPETLPEADAIINPLQPHCGSSAKQLAGVGVAFYFAMGIREYLRDKGYWSPEREPNLKRYLDLVAIGTIADMAPMTGVNRILVTAGLQVLEQRQRVGLLHLLTLADNNKQQVSGETVAFKIAPRLNAAGRISHANVAIELLLAEKYEVAQKVAGKLEEMNHQRKQIERDFFDDVLPIAEGEIQQGRNILVIWGDFHPGVLGIVASRLADRFSCPAILLSLRDGMARGSGRSIEGLNLFRCIESCSNLLVQYGGHKAAAGMTIDVENLSVFRDAIEKAIQNEMDSKEFQPELWVDSKVELAEVFNREFISLYSRLEPFGIGNPEPVFAGSVDSFHTLSVVGKDHLRFSIPVKGKIRSGIGFGLGNQLETIKASNQNTFAFKLRRNFFRGKSDWQMNLIDICSDT